MAQVGMDSHGPIFDSFYSIGAMPFYDVRLFGARGNGVSDDTVAIQAAIDAANADGGGVVWLKAGIYLISSSIVLRSGVTVKGNPTIYQEHGIVDLTGIIENGTILTGTANPAFIGNNINGGGLEYIAIDQMNGLSLGKQNQFGPQFWRCDYVTVYNPPDYGMRLYNFGQITSTKLSVFSYYPTVVPTEWYGLDLISENDPGNAVTLDHTTGVFTVGGGDAALSYVNGDTIYFQSGTLPTPAAGLPMSTGVPYYVRDAAGVTYRISRTPGGAAIDFTDDGLNLVLGGCNFQPGNSVFISPYILWQHTPDLVARTIRGYRGIANHPTYGGNAHQGQIMGLINFIRPQANMFGYTGVLAGSDRYCMAFSGLASGGLVTTSVSGLRVEAADLEGKNEYGFYGVNLVQSQIDIAAVSSPADFAAGLYLRTSTDNTVFGNIGLTLDVDYTSSSRLFGFRSFKGQAAGSAGAWPLGSYYTSDDGCQIHQDSILGYGYTKSTTGFCDIRSSQIQTATVVSTVTADGGTANLGKFIYVSPAGGGAAITITMEAAGSVPGAHIIFYMTGHAFDATITPISGGDITLNAVGDSCEVVSNGSVWAKVWSVGC